MGQCHDHSELTEHVFSNHLLLNYLISKLSTENLLSTGNPIQPPRNPQRLPYAMTFCWEKAPRSSTNGMDHWHTENCYGNLVHQAFAKGSCCTTSSSLATASQTGPPATLMIPISRQGDRRLGRQPSAERWLTRKSQACLICPATCNHAKKKRLFHMKSHIPLWSRGCVDSLLFWLALSVISRPCLSSL